MLVVCAGCSGNGDDGDAAPTYACGPPPSHCESRLCVRENENPTFADCCDSAYCNCKPSTRQWTLLYCDPAPPDARTFDAQPGDAATAAAP